MNASKHRIEADSMGEMRIPGDALWGAQTQRAIENFPISGIRFPPIFIHSLGRIKQVCAEANRKLGVLTDPVAGAVIRAAIEVADGGWDDHFPLDIFQTGSGTSTNMNANEVIANRANILLGGAPGTRSPVHPNDHVNKGQSSNDVIPTAIHVAAVLALRHHLKPALERMLAVLRKHQAAFHGVVKSGRTHLQDATPVTLGQVFGGYAEQIDKGIRRVDRGMDALRELALGGTAVGTGLNRHPRLHLLAIEGLNCALGETFRAASNAMEANASRDSLVEASGALRTVAVSLTRIGEDIRWMASGPRNGLGELQLPEVQPGSSIMPGKVNPVIIESLLMVCAHVMGSDLSMTLSGLGGRFELNMMMPLMAHHFLQAVSLLTASVDTITDRCLKGLRADTETCAAGVRRNLSLVTALVPVIGYDRAAQISKIAFETGRTVREVAEEMSDVPAKDLDRILDPRRMT